VDSIGKEIRQVGNENDKTTLRLGKASDICELESQGSGDADHDSDEQASKEDAEEDTNSFEQAEYTERLGAILVLLCGLEQDNGNGIVQDGLAKDDGVEFRLDFVGVEDGKDGDGVCGGEGSAYRHGLDEVDLEAVQRYSRPQKQYDAQDNGGDEGTGECEGEDGANVAEEVALAWLASD
jgi:hypothetical protein